MVIKGKYLRRIVRFVGINIETVRKHLSVPDTVSVRQGVRVVASKLTRVQQTHEVDAIFIPTTRNALNQRHGNQIGS